MTESESKQDSNITTHPQYSMIANSGVKNKKKSEDLKIIEKQIHESKETLIKLTSVNVDLGN